ncbi:MAG: hypothetical protein M3S32_03140 [Acidobacteriota bacterium]|nr:hypothetical protein [Acidobacteriota bacterium]
MRRLDPGRESPGSEVAVVASSAARARAAAVWLAPALPESRLRPFSLSGYGSCRGNPLPLILAAAGADREADREFLLAARDRLLWPAASGDLYDAIAGVLTHLPARRRAPAGDRGPATALLLEGTVTAERVRSALRSSARHWIVEHVGRVRVSAAEMKRLSEEGVRWSALEPARLVGVADPARAARGIFPRGTPIFRPAPPRAAPAGSVSRAPSRSARRRTPSTR